MFFDNNSIIDKIRYCFNFIMIAFYLIIGGLFLFSDVLIHIFPVYREAVGLIFIIYGAFRLYLSIKRKGKKAGEIKNW